MDKLEQSSKNLLHVAPLVLFAAPANRTLVGPHCLNEANPVTCGYCLALNAAAVADHAASEFPPAKLALGSNVPVPPGRLSTTKE
jgi:hypothetical protein